jgi:hypothetical protein
MKTILALSASEIQIWISVVFALLCLLISYLGHKAKEKKLSDASFSLTMFFLYNACRNIIEISGPVYKKISGSSESSLTFYELSAYLFAAFMVFSLLSAIYISLPSGRNSLKAK